MVRFTLAVAALTLSACVSTPPPQPGPVHLQSPRSPAEVVQAAAQQLRAAGFEITASDSAAGRLTATRTRERRGNFDYITCKFAENSLAETNLVSTLTVSVTASRASAQTSVDIDSSVRATYPGLEDSPLPRADSQTDCASTGTLERQLAETLRGSA